MIEISLFNFKIRVIEIWLKLGLKLGLKISVKFFISNQNFEII